MEIAYFSSKDIIGRLVLAACAIAVLVFSVYSIKWGFANAAAKQADNIETAEMMADLSPNDPETHYIAAKLLENSFEADDYDKALLHYETAVALSPHKYFAWLELAKARDNRGDTSGAMSAFSQAEKLAPNYSIVHWSLGNARVRRGDTASGLAMLKYAAERQPTYAGPFAALALQISGGDVDAAMTTIGDSPHINNSLVLLLINEKRIDDALKVWQKIPLEAKRSQLKDTGATLFSHLVAAFRYRQAIAIKRESDELSEIKIGEIFNGGFELPVKPNGAEVFDWQISDGGNPQFLFVDKQIKTGNYSLLLMFDPADRAKSVRSLSQAVAVESGKRYQFSVAYRATLNTNTDFRWVIKNAADDQVLASGEPIRNSETWLDSKLLFNVPANSDAIRISLVRDICSQAVCAVSGQISLDDIGLTEIR